MLIISILLNRKQEQVSYYNSFLPSAIQLWNKLPLESKCIESFHTFKNVLKKPVVERTKNIFNYGSRRENIIHCQLRNESSDLKAHLFNYVYVSLHPVTTVDIHARIITIFSLPVLLLIFID